MMLRWVTLALLVGVCAGAGEQKKKVKAPSLANGWGNNIKWVKTYEEGLSEMKKRESVQKIFCSNIMNPLRRVENLNRIISTALKKAFVADKSIQKMAKEDFIMVNLMEETPDKNMAPDGYYVPRILFVDPSMTVRTNIIGKHSNHLYTYLPEDMEHLAENMKKAKLLIHEEL